MFSQIKEYRCNLNGTPNFCSCFGFTGTFFIILLNVETEYNFCFHLDERRPSGFAVPENYIFKSFDTLNQHHVNS